MNKFLHIALSLVYIPIVATVLYGALVALGFDIFATVIIGFWFGCILCWIMVWAVWR